MSIYILAGQLDGALSNGSSSRLICLIGSHSKSPADISVLQLVLIRSSRPYPISSPSSSHRIVSMTVRYVPQEIWNATIDKLANDPESLKESSSTCRSWHPRSRKHLFDEISIYDEPARRRYEKLVEASIKLAEVTT